MSERVAVVGASGPLGRAVTRELRATDNDIVALSRSGTAAHHLDATIAASVQRMLESVGPATVVYLARPDLASGGDTTRAIDRAIAAFTEFTAACADHGVRRLLFASSAAVYGTDTRAARREQEPVVGSSAYADLKIRSEAVLDAARARRALETAAFRIFNVYGPGFDSSLVNRLVIGSDPPPVVFTTDQFVRDYIHGDDVARLLAEAVERPSLPTAVVNVGTGVGTSNRTLLALLPESAAVASGDPAAPSFSVADTTVLREEWGFSPAIELTAAVRRPELFAT